MVNTIELPSWLTQLSFHDQITKLAMQEMVTPILELCKVLLRLDMPSAAIEQYNAALQAHPSDSSLLLGLARCHDDLGDSEKALQVRGMGNMDRTTVQDQKDVMMSWETPGNLLRVGVTGPYKDCKGAG
eukprot:1147687-Pelagomonas_calceolata.AAC.5